MALPNWFWGNSLALHETVASALAPSSVSVASKIKYLTLRQAKFQKLTPIEPFFQKAGFDFQGVPFETSSAVSWSFSVFMKAQLSKFADVNFKPRTKINSGILPKDKCPHLPEEL